MEKRRDVSGGERERRERERERERECVCVCALCSKTIGIELHEFC